MGMTAKITETSRAMQTAEGLLRGIAADSIIAPAELEHIREWLGHHESLRDIVPFSELYSFLEEVQADGNLSASAQDEFLDFCLSYESANGPVDALTKNIRSLHGLLQGIAADDKISVDELRYLEGWINAHSFDLGRWPFREVHNLIGKILEDGKVTKKEQKEMLDFCANFSLLIQDDQTTDDTIMPDRPFLKNNAPVVQTIQSIVDTTSEIIITNRTYCFTGTMKAGKRKDIENELTQAGGIPANGVSKKLHYLVIGANSNPCWSYATYGRKIEKVMRFNDEGASILILHEDRFLGDLRP
jgi:hypothetical protein